MNGRFYILILLITLAACQRDPYRAGSYELDTFTKNDVTVVTTLEVAGSGEANLIATFTRWSQRCICTAWICH